MDITFSPKSLVLEKKYMSWIVLIVCLSLTFSISFYVMKRNTTLREREFNNQFTYIKNQITERMEEHARILQSGAALFNASDNLTRKEWYTFSHHQNIDKLLPGIIGFGFAIVVPPKKLLSHINEMRREGFPGFKVKPESARNFYTSVLFLEPFSGRNINELGYDMYSDPILRSAMEKSRDLNEPVLSGKVSSLQKMTDSEEQLEAVMFVPVYHKGLSLKTIEDRRMAIYGWVYSPYRIKELFLGIQTDPNSTSNYYRHFQVFDNEEISIKNLIYEDLFQGDSRRLLSSKNFSRKETMNFYGQKWTLHFTQIYDDLFSMENINIWIILFIGSIISLLLYRLVYSLQKARSDALKLAESLKESEERLIFATEASGIGVWDLDLIDMSAVRSLEHDKIFGYSELLPSWTYDIFLKHVIEEDREIVSKKFLQAIESQGKWSFECRIKRVDKKIRWIWATGRHSADPSGKKRRIAGIVQDITERKKSEEEHAMLAAIVTFSSDAIISLDLNGKITSWNQGAQKLFGYSSEEVLNQPISILNPLDRQYEENENELLNRLSLGKKIEHFETIRLSKDKKLIDVSISSSPIINNQGKIVGASKIFRNITELKIAEKELSIANSELLKAKAAAELANAAKSNFLSNMSHEIRTPMNAIIGMANLLSETKLDAQQLRYVDVFKKSGFNLLHIINDILDISKIESGKFSIDNSEFYPRDIIHDMMEILKIKAEEKKLILNYEVSLDVPEKLFGDAFRIKQVLTNLIDNSIKFTNSGSIHVEVCKNFDISKKGNIFFSVVDTGIGINKEVQEKLFHSYTQANSSTTKMYGGTGLGLAISKKLVESMGGEIWLESEEGVGTKVSFTLSCLEASTKDLAQKHKDSAEVKITNSHVLKILLADDSEFNRFLIKEYLKDGNHIIVEAENGEIAVDKAKKEKFDIILMDIQMPIMDGYTATKEIRDWEKKHNHRHVPIVAITAYALKEEEDKSLAVGCDQHLSKPIMKDNLLEALETLTQT